jgi:hypothetical protein
MTGVVIELREWRAAENIKNRNFQKDIQGLEDKIDKAIALMQWFIGIGVTVALGFGGLLINHLIK